MSDAKDLDDNTIIKNKCLATTYRYIESTQEKPENEKTKKGKKKKRKKKRGKKK